MYLDQAYIIGEIIDITLFNTQNITETRLAKLY